MKLLNCSEIFLFLNFGKKTKWLKLNSLNNKVAKGKTIKYLLIYKEAVVLQWQS